MKKANSEVTQERLDSLLRLDAEAGQFFWIDREDEDEDEAAGRLLPNGYRYIMIDGLNYGAHRLVWFVTTGQWPIGQIDHRDGDHDNNRHSNLRDLSHAHNQQNRRVASACNETGLLGVRFRRGRYWSQITIDKKARHLGCFSTGQEAHQAYLDAKRANHPGCTI